MTDHLDKLANTALDTVDSGYYALGAVPPPSSRPSFVAALRDHPHRSVIAEVKPSSPSGGRLIGERSPNSVVDLYAKTPVSGLSVLVEPVHFGGSLQTLRYAVNKGLPVLFKDFVLDPVQLDAAAACGAAAVLLILALFERGYARLPLAEMIDAARARGLEVLLEVYNGKEYARSLATRADMIGINNRDLKTLEVDLDTTKAVLGCCDKDRPVWSLSGVNALADLQYLERCGADAFLVGSALMRSKHPQKLLEQLLRQ